MFEEDTQTWFITSREAKVEVSNPEQEVSYVLPKSGRINQYQGIDIPNSDAVLDNGFGDYYIQACLLTVGS